MLKFEIKMKKIQLAILSIGLFSITSAQGTLNMPTYDSFFERIYIDGMKESLSYSDIHGSAYANSDFLKAKIGDGYENIVARYNSYMDQVEFKKDNQIYVLEKSDKFPRITFMNTDEVLILLNINGKSEYFYELYSDDNKQLFKKVKTILNKPEKSKNSYASEDTSLGFETSNVYYLGYEGKYYKVPEKLKKAVDIFPSRKSELESKLKANKISLSDEKGLISFVKLL